MFALQRQGITNFMVGLITYILGSWIFNSFIIMLIGSIFVIRGIYYSTDLKSLIPSIGKFGIIKTILWLFGGYGLYVMGVRVLGMAMQAFGAYSGFKNIVSQIWIPLDAVEDAVGTGIASLQNSACAAIYQLPVIGKPLSYLNRDNNRWILQDVWWILGRCPSEQEVDEKFETKSIFCMRTVNFQFKTIAVLISASHHFVHLL